MSIEHTYMNIFLQRAKTDKSSYFVYGYFKEWHVVNIFFYHIGVIFFEQSTCIYLNVYIFVTFKKGTFCVPVAVFFFKYSVFFKLKYSFYHTISSS